jgi:hypothetical protein
LAQLISDAIRIKQFTALGQKLVAKFEQLPPGGRFGAPSRAGFTRELCGQTRSDCPESGALPKAEV